MISRQNIFFTYYQKWYYQTWFTDSVQPPWRFQLHSEEWRALEEDMRIVSSGWMCKHIHIPHKQAEWSTNANNNELHFFFFLSSHHQDHKWWQMLESVQRMRNLDHCWVIETSTNQTLRPSIAVTSSFPPKQTGSSLPPPAAAAC